LTGAYLSTLSGIKYTDVAVADCENGIHGAVARAERKREREREREARSERPAAY
jgi:hypothetical protein